MKKYIIAFILILSISFSVFSAIKNTSVAGAGVTYFDKLNNSDINPANTYFQNWFFHLNFASVNAEMYNSSYSLSDYNKFVSIDTMTVSDKNDFLSKIDGNLLLNQTTKLNFLSGKFGKVSFNLGTEIKMKDISFPKRFLELLFYGNKDYPVSFSGDESEASIIGKLSLNYSDMLSYNKSKHIFNYIGLSNFHAYWDKFFVYNNVRDNGYFKNTYINSINLYQSIADSLKSYEFPLLDLENSGKMEETEFVKKTRNLQYLLSANGYSVDITGRFGQDTYDALIQFQDDKNLPATGEASRETWLALLAYKGIKKYQVRDKGAELREVNVRKLRYDMVNYPQVIYGVTADIFFPIPVPGKSDIEKDIDENFMLSQFYRIKRNTLHTSLDEENLTGYDVNQVFEVEAGEYGYGLGLNFGSTVLLTERLTAGVSLRNFPSFINWKGGKGYTLTTEIDSFFVTDFDSIDVYYEQNDSLNCDDFTTFAAPVFNIGVSYKAFSTLTLHGEIEQGFKESYDISTTPKLMMAAQYQPWDWLFLNTGLSFGGKKKYTQAFGWGLEFEFFNFIMSIENIGGLGESSRGVSSYFELSTGF